jgi:hypothetical protein
MCPKGSGGAGASAADANYALDNWRVLLDDVQATLGWVSAMLALRSISLRRTALHLPLRRSERGLLYFSHGLLRSKVEGPKLKMSKL